MKRDGSIKLQLKVEYFTLANFTKACEHVNTLLVFLPGPWKGGS